MDHWMEVRTERCVFESKNGNGRCYLFRKLELEGEWEGERGGKKHGKMKGKGEGKRGEKKKKKKKAIKKYGKDHGQLVTNDNSNHVSFGAQPV